MRDASMKGFNERGVLLGAPSQLPAGGLVPYQQQAMLPCLYSSTAAGGLLLWACHPCAGPTLRPMPRRGGAQQSLAAASRVSCRSIGGSVLGLLRQKPGHVHARCRAHTRAARLVTVGGAARISTAAGCGGGAQRSTSRITMQQAPGARTSRPGVAAADWWWGSSSSNNASLSACSFRGCLLIRMSSIRLLTVSAVSPTISEASVPIARKEANGRVPHLLPVFFCKLSEVCFREHQHVWLVPPNESGDIPGVRVQPSHVIGPPLVRPAAARVRRASRGPYRTSSSASRGYLRRGHVQRRVARRDPRRHACGGGVRAAVIARVTSVGRQLVLSCLSR
ncbi:hypothetical protein FOA52_006621 [Chlamydomonas sp. UWO 241]|nr:hypothetical protein FOA52_006621 [Chlamydomonas sp. UWO 241]